MHRKILLFLSLIVCAQLSAFEIIDRGDVLEIYTEYGNSIIDEDVLIQIIRSSGFNRLQHIRQYGTTFYARTEANYTRFEHSIGVFMILRLYGASLEEQIAGLLHDASHTVYSHVADHLFVYDTRKGAYQDSIHEWALEELGIMAILKNHHLEHACSAELKESLRALKQPYPDLCADRIEYNLKGGLFEGLITKEDIAAVIRDLRFDGTHWYLTSVESARIIADTSLTLCDTIWGASWHNFVYKCTAQALKHALRTHVITSEDIHFSTDDIIWHKLTASNDPVLQHLIDRIRNWQQYMADGTAERHNVHTQGKFSGVDPLIMTETGFKRLTECDAEFKTEYDRIKNKVKNGAYILFTTSAEQILNAMPA